MSTTTSACPACGSVNSTISWQQFANGTKHLRRDCNDCCRYLGYVKQTPDNLYLEALGPAPSSTAPDLFTPKREPPLEGSFGIWKQEKGDLVLCRGALRLAVPLADLRSEEWFRWVVRAAELPEVTPIDLRYLTRASAALRGLTLRKDGPLPGMAQ